ncbi:MAG: NAD-dependent epimerase/dehydratase family protein [Gemmatimonadaceae bacterium]
MSAPRKHSLFITGATGYVGRSLLSRIPFESFEAIYCLSREGKPPSSPGRQVPVTWIRGRLEDAKLYGPFLSACDTVLHLAAVSGKARPQEFDRVNRGSTELLLQQCARAGVRNFLYVSTIATRFSDNEYYHYARSKLRAEEAVRRSAQHYTIVRPTIVAGSGSPVWQRLEKLANAPLSLMIGDGSARVQPIHVDDLADRLLDLIIRSKFDGRTLELGGPEVVTMADLLRRFHRARHGKDPRFIRMPYRPLVRLLALIERPLFNLLPVTAGQLASFANDGVARESIPEGEHHRRMKTIDEMIHLGRDNV